MPQGMGGTAGHIDARLVEASSQPAVDRIRSVSRVSNLTALSVMISSQEELRHGDEAEGVGATGSAVAS
jgi:hypothetical protein